MSSPLEPVVLFDDAGFLVASKPSGMLSEGGGLRELDLEQAVSAMVGRPVYCCHRLDRLTSGVVALRKGKQLSKELARLFEAGAARKEYWMLVEGVWDKRIQRIETYIGQVGKGIYGNVESGGKRAVSTFQLLGVSRELGVSLVRGLLKTGRTHQLRLHAQSAGCPVLGDPLYGRARPDGLFGLHARSLSLRHPQSGEALRFEAEPPESWSELLRALRD